MSYSFHTSKRGIALLGVVFLLAFSFPGISADTSAPHRGHLLECRPCGPDSVRGPLRYLFFQGCAGADFRLACIQHDAGYDTLGSNKEECDRKFLEAMLVECEKSKFPGRARFRARLAYLGVKLAGRSAWISAQKLALKLQASVDSGK